MKQVKHSTGPPATRPRPWKTALTSTSHRLHSSRKYCTTSRAQANDIRPSTGHPWTTPADRPAERRVAAAPYADLDAAPAAGYGPLEVLPLLRRESHVAAEFVQDYETFDLGDLTLQHGVTLEDAKLAYKTFGELNA